MGSLPNYSILKGENRPFTNQQLHRIFEKVADEVCPETVAVTFEDDSQRYSTNITYKQLNYLSNQLARGIVKCVTSVGGKSNSDGDYIVSVCMAPSDKLIITLLAIWKAGCAYLPLDPTFPKARIEHILNESKPVLAIYDNTPDIDQSAFTNTFSLSYDELCNESEKNHGVNLYENEQFHHEKDDLGIVLYTSGSTGVPKGVRLPFSIMLNRLQWQWHKFPYSYTEKYCIFKTALTFVDSVCEIWGPLLNGLNIVVVPKSITKDPVKLVALMDRYQIERLVLVPSLLRSLILYLSLEKQVNPLKSLKIWVCSGESLPVSLAEEFFKYFKGQRILCNFYGSTEIMGDVTYHTVTDASELQGFDKVPIGIPLDNTIVYLLDNEMKPVSTGNVGELYVSGFNVAAGYVNGRDPDKFINNPLVMDIAHCRLYKTGDYARIVKGVLQYEGRTDSQVKVRGHRVDLAEVEKAVAATPYVEKAVCLCYKPGEIDQALVTFVTLQNDAQHITGLQIEDYLQQKLTSYMIPQVIVLENIPLLVNGKTDRQTLLKMYGNTNNNGDSEIHIDIDYTDVPEDQMEAAKVLFETVGSVIGHSTRLTLNLRSNFYQLGGNSLNSIYTVTKLRDLGYVIAITDFIRAANMDEILNKMVKESSNIYDDTNINEISNEYQFDMLRNEHKNDVCKMIATSFYEKADLEQWIKPDISINDYDELIHKAWDALIEKDLSFVVCDKKNGEIIGVALNFDAHDEPEIEINSRIVVILEFLEYIEAPVRDNLLPPGKGSILHGFMMATKDTITAQENVLLMQAMEAEMLRVAKRKQFLGILTTNTSPLTQQLGKDVYQYKIMNDYQVNQYVANDKSRPFREAPDSQRAVVSWKEV